MSMRPKPWLLLLLAASLGAFLAAPAGARPLAAVPGFHAPVVLPGSAGGNEPSLAVSSGGTRYPSWQAPGHFASSTDGVHFADLGEPDSGSIGDVTNAISASGALYNGQLCGDPNDILHSCI